MASPSETRTSTSVATAATSFNINVGSPAASQLLVVFVRFAGAPGTVTFTGYTPFVSAEASDASDDVTYLFYREATGSEGATDPLSCVNSVKLASITWIVTGAEDPAVQAPQNSTVAVGTNTAPDATTVTPTGGSKDYLFLYVLGCDGETQTFGIPATYANLVNQNSGTGGAAATNCRVGGGSRQLTAASEDPAAASLDLAPTTGWTAFVVAVHPPAPAAFLAPPEKVELQAVIRASVW